MVIRADAAAAVDELEGLQLDYPRVDAARREQLQPPARRSWAAMPRPHVGAGGREDRQLVKSGRRGAAAGEQGLAEEWLSLEECRGSPVVLVFYPADFTPVCGEELTIFSELMPEVERHGARVLGISVDSAWCHRAFAQDRHLQVSLLADFHPKGEVSRRYDAHREQDGFSERALFVLDREGKVFWSYLSPIDVNPGADGVLDALDRLDGELPEDDAQQASREQPARGGQQQEGRP